VIAVADALNQQDELDETNNRAASAPLTMTAYQPDLVITALSVPATAQVGGKLAITHSVRNAGPAPAGAFAIRFYLSSDDALDTGDVLLGTRNLAGLGAGASSPSISTFTVPSTLPPAGYRVLAVADALAQQAELDEADNVAASGVVTVSP
jgi:subtilase family serine protease